MTRSGVVGGRESRITAPPVARQADDDRHDRAHPVDQPAGRQPGEQDGDPIRDEEQPDVRAGRLGPLGQERHDDAPVGDEQQVDER